MSSGRILALAASALFAALAGCGESAPEPSAPASSGPKPAAKPKGAVLPSEMVAAVAAGKSSSLVGVHFSLASTPVVGTPLPLQIAIVPHEPITTVRVIFESQDGLTISKGENFGPVSDAEPEKALTHQLMLLPVKEGMYMVTVSVDTVADEGNIVRSFSIPVLVGPAKPSEAPAPK